MIKLIFSTSLILLALPALGGNIFEGALSKNVFGYNDRSSVPSTSNALGAGFIGKLIKPNGGYCTASLVGKNLILTNAHCVAKAGSFIEGTYTFKLGFDRGKSIAESRVNRIWYGTLEPEKNQWADDWAIFRLDEPLGETYGFFGVHKNPNYKFPFSIAGYGREFSSRYLTIQNSCKVQGQSIGQLLHDCDISPGDSGAPMFICGHNMCSIVALQSGERRNGREGTATLEHFDMRDANVAVHPSRFYSTLVKLKQAEEEELTFDSP